ncbi:hypothetical protein DFH08DRAFT_928473 [Mycena albidolilacea]|uniref:DUF6570 domain-containing protein n=1 Tax=Mycena albidolilacea TaxID=1033008 RepID=A0AAD7AUC0_9AGAR|nr:hypothetical protein DFH08DRAFT_928473 [Mycena albidolilacea]
MTKLAKSHYKSLLLWKRMAVRRPLGFTSEVIERARVIPDDDQPNKRHRIKVKQLYPSKKGVKPEQGRKRKIESSNAANIEIFWHTWPLSSCVGKKPVSMQRLGSACDLGRASESFEAAAERLRTSFKLFEGSVLCEKPSAELHLGADQESTFVEQKESVSLAFSGSFNPPSNLQFNCWPRQKRTLGKICSLGAFHQDVAVFARFARSGVSQACISSLGEEIEDGGGAFTQALHLKIYSVVELDISILNNVVASLRAHYAQPKIQCIKGKKFFKIPLHSWANGCWIGSVPEELATLTYVEELDISLAHTTKCWPQTRNAVHGKKAKDKEESEDNNYEFITVDRTLRTWPVNANAEPHLSDMVGQFMVNDFIVFDKGVLPTDIPHMLKPDTMVECLFKLQYHHINRTHLFTEQICILRPAIEAVPSLVNASPSKPYRPPAMSKLQFQQRTAIAEPSSFLAATSITSPSHASGSKSSQKRKASEEPEGSAPKCVDASGGKDSGSSLNQ